MTSLLKRTNSIIACSLLMAWGAHAIAAEHTPEIEDRFAPLPPQEFVGEPPLDPAAWYRMEGELPAIDRLWGRDHGVSPTAVVPMKGGVGLFYSTRVPEGWIKDGHRPHRVTCLAFSENLLDWEDYADNPVLYRRADWMSSRRLSMGNIHYDAENEQWLSVVALTGGRNWPGVRAAAAATSTNLIDWTFGDGPILTVLDYVGAIPDLSTIIGIEVSEEMIHEWGRAYLRWSVEKDGTWYAVVQGPGLPPDDRNYQQIVMKSESYDGPWEFIGTTGDVFSGVTPKEAPVQINGRWYAMYSVSGRDGEKPRIGLAVSDGLFGPYDGTPLFEVESDSTGRLRGILFQHNGIWGLAYSRHYLHIDEPGAPFGLAITKDPATIARP